LHAPDWDAATDALYVAGWMRLTHEPIGTLDGMDVYPLLPLAD
jgi:hypothetical protein